MNKNKKKTDGLSIVQAIDAGGWGGAENVVVHLARGLAKRGHHVEVWVRRGSFLTEKLPGSVNVRVVPFLNDYEPFTTARFVHALKTHDIVNVHLGRAARLSGYAAKISPPWARNRLICHMHLYHKPKHYRLQKRIICVSRAVEEYVLEAMPWVDRTWMIHNGITTEGALEAAPLVPKNEDVVRIGLLATFKAQKGQADLLFAFSKMSPVIPCELILGGKGETLEPMKKLASDLGIADKVIFTGFVPPEDIFSFWRSLDVACMPSKAEGCSLSAVEAMASGLPVVAYAEPALSEVIGDSGILVARGDTDVLARTLEKVAGDASLRAKYSRLSLERSKGFTEDAMVEKTLEVYRQVVEESRLEQTAHLGSGG
jgi:glycosyltransferase involved in cell wall biosynthesis